MSSIVIKSGRMEDVFFKKKKKSNSKEVLCSAEKTDEELVQRALEMHTQLPLTIDDLFTALGPFSNLYVRSIVLNALIWAVGELHYKTDDFIKQNSRAFSFSDKNGMSYGIQPDEIAKQKSGGGGDDGDINVVLISVFRNLGVLFLIYMNRMGRRYLVLLSGILYALCSTFFLVDYKPVIRLGIGLRSMFTVVIRYTACMHISESIPPKMLPFAFSIFYLITTATSIGLNLGLRLGAEWKYMGLAVGIIQGLASVAYAVWAPAPLLLSLANYKARDIKKTLDRWLKNPDVIDVNTLIDDTMFHGKPMVHPWDRIRELLLIRHFSLKFVALIVLFSVRSRLTSATGMALTKLVSFSFYERVFLESTLSGIAPITFGIIMIHKFGRRHTIMISLMVSIMSLSIINHIRLEEFNMCAMSAVPAFNGRMLTTILVVVCVMARTVLKMTLLVCLLNHIPIQQHSILFPIGMLINNLIRPVYGFITGIITASWSDNQETNYPNQEFILALTYAFVFLPFVLVIDNSSAMSLTATDIQCYRFHSPKYPEHPVRNDCPAADQDVSESSIE